MSDTYWWNKPSAIGNSMFTNFQQILTFFGLGSMFMTSYLVDLKHQRESKMDDKVPNVHGTRWAGALVIIFLNIISLHL